MFQRTFARPAPEKPEGFDGMITIQGARMPASGAALHDYGQIVLQQVAAAKPLERAGDVVYAKAPFTTQRRGPQARPAPRPTEPQARPRPRPTGPLDRWARPAAVPPRSAPFSASPSPPATPMQAPAASRSTLHPPGA